MNSCLMTVVNVPVYTKYMVLKAGFIPSSERQYALKRLHKGRGETREGGCNRTLEGGGDVYRGGDSSTAGVTRL